MASTPKIIVVGGGLAGLAAVIKIAEMGGQRRSVLHRAGKALALRLRPGRHQRRQKSEGRRRFHLAAFRRHRLRRRLPGQPAAGQGHVRSRSRHHRSARPHGRALQPHSRRTARLPPLRRHPLQPHRLRRRHHGPATSLRARRAGAPLRIRRQSPQIRTLGISLRRARFQPRLPRHLRHGFAFHGSPHLPRRRHHHRHRRQRRHLRHAPQTPSSVPDQRSRRSISRAATTPTASSFRSIPRAFPAKTSCA